jgi:hypothetical protein
MTKPAARVPPAAAWLGGLGAAPFIGLALGAALLRGAPRLAVIHALVTYGATILSFLGGVHWGLAIGAREGAERGRLTGRLLLSVVPSLTGWAALLLPDTAGLWVLACAVAAMLWVDLRATRLGEAPLWYPRLRVPLTCAVVTALLFGALA